MDAYRGIHRKPAAMYPTPHPITISLIDQAATDEGAQNPPTHPRLHFGDGDRIQPSRCMKIHTCHFDCIDGWLECSIDDATVKTKFQRRLTLVSSTLSEAAGTKMDMLVERRTEAMDESDRPYAGLGVATEAAFAQAPFHLAQKNAQHGTLQGHITLQEIAQAFGHREHPLMELLANRLSTIKPCKSGPIPKRLYGAAALIALCAGLGTFGCGNHRAIPFLS
jgi:hypothetical protein